MPGAWDWPDFQRDIRALQRIAELLNDSWEIVTTSNAPDECSQYLRICTKRLGSLPETPIDGGSAQFEADINLPDDPSTAGQTSNLADTLLAYEFHVLFHPSYRVPALYFKATRHDGRPLTLDEAWHLFRGSVTGGASMTGIITEMHHPVLGTAFLALHPCRTGELLDEMSGSKNRVLTFLSTLGAAVNLELDVRYGVMINEMCDKET